MRIARRLFRMMRALCVRILHWEKPLISIHGRSGGRLLCGAFSDVPLNRLPRGHHWVWLREEEKITCCGCRDKAAVLLGHDEATQVTAKEP